MFFQIPFHKFQVIPLLLYLGSTVSIDSVSDQGISGTNRAIEEDAVVTVGDWS